jgi:hypothetical protein
MPLAGDVGPAVKRARDLALTSFCGGVLLWWQYGRFVTSPLGQQGLLLLALGLLVTGVVAIVRRPVGAPGVLAPAIAGVAVTLAMTVFSALFVLGILVATPTN